MTKALHSKIDQLLNKRKVRYANNLKEATMEAALCPPNDWEMLLIVNPGTAEEVEYCWDPYTRSWIYEDIPF